MIFVVHPGIDKEDPLVDIITKKAHALAWDDWNNHDHITIHLMKGNSRGSWFITDKHPITGEEEKIPVGFQMITQVNLLEWVDGKQQATAPFYSFAPVHDWEDDPSERSVKPYWHGVSWPNNTIKGAFWTIIKEIENSIKRVDHEFKDHGLPTSLYSEDMDMPGIQRYKDTLALLQKAVSVDEYKRIAKEFEEAVNAR